MALYNAVFRVVDALRLFPAAVLAVALPVLCRAAISSRWSGSRPFDGGGLRRLGRPLADGILVVPAIYGAPYADARPAVPDAGLALPLMALNYALTQQLIGWHGQRA